MSHDYKGAKPFTGEIQSSVNLPVSYREFSAWTLMNGHRSYDFEPTDAWECQCIAWGENCGITVSDHEDFSLAIQLELQDVLIQRYPKAHVVLFTMPR